MAINFKKFFRDLFRRPPTPQPEPIPQPVDRIISTTVPNGADGFLYLDNGDGSASKASPNGRLDFRIRPEATGGATLILKLEGYADWSGRVVIPLDGEIDTGTIVMEPNKRRLPPVPTRAQVCAIKMSLQGLTYETRDYGRMPGVFFWSVYEDRKDSVFPAHRKAGDTHLPVGISGSYNEPNTIWPPEITKGGDSSGDLAAFKAQIREVIVEGFFADVVLSGDGQSNRPGTREPWPRPIQKGQFNDTVGSTYGYQWLMDNLPRILKAIRGDADSECPDGEDLTPYCIFRPGWDGVFQILLAILYGLCFYA